MVLRVKVFREVIGQVFLSRVPPEIKKHTLTLVRDPEKTHFHAAGSLFLDCVIGNARGRLVVAVNGRGGLLVSELLQNQSDDLAFFAVEEKCPQFCLRCRRNHKFQYACKDMDCPI